MKRLALLLLGLTAAGVASAHSPGGGHSTTVNVASCSVSPVDAGSATVCTIQVRDTTGNNGRDPPLSMVPTVSSTLPGTFGTVTCSAVPGTTTAFDGLDCTVSFTPTAAGAHSIGASFAGGSGTSPDPDGGTHAWAASSDATPLTLNVDPVLTLVSPAFASRGQAPAITLTGNGFAGAPTLSLTVAGTGVAVGAVTIDSQTQLSTTFTVANDATATLGLRDVTVTVNGRSRTLTNGFEVRNAVPTITSINPTTVEAGSGALTLTVTGTGYFSDTSTVQFDGASRTTTFISATELQAALPAGDAAVAGIFPITVVNSGTGGGTSNSVNFTVTTVGPFNAVEVGGSVPGNIYTKLAGTAFTLDILGPTGFTGNATVVLQDASDDSGTLDADGCRDSWVTLGGSSKVLNYVPADNARKQASWTVGGAWRKLRVRADATGVKGCSTDAFVVRPTALTLASTLNNSGTGGTPIAPAGDAFTMTATAIAGYDGTPQIDTALLSAHTGAVATGTLAGSFDAAVIGTGVATGTGFTYDEVGAFRLAAQGVYDQAFTTATDSLGVDCTDDFSNTLVGGRYGCRFGTTAVSQWVGRFVPHHFDTSVTHGCTGGATFTYSGQTFSVTVTARATDGSRTDNFNFAMGADYAKTVTLSDSGDATGFSANTLDSTDFASGEASTSSVVFGFPVRETAPETLEVRATDTDGRDSSAGTEGSTEARAGRMALSAAVGPETQALSMPVRVESWADIGGSVFDWATETGDTCTTIATGDFSEANDTAGTTIGSVTALSSGAGSVNLTTPAGAGTVDITMTGAATWFLYDWDSDAAHDDDPSARASFGVYSGRPRVISSRDER